MIVKTSIIPFFTSVLISGTALADGSSLSPTNSRSGTLIQTDAFPDKQPIFKRQQLRVNEAGGLKYKTARSALQREIARFGNLSKKAQKSLSPNHKKALRASLQKISRHAKVIEAISRRAKNKAGMGIASRIIIDDDITGKFLTNDGISGKPSMLLKAAKRLRGLEGKLGLLEPVVYR